jgi:hypothetical protein
VNLELLWPLAGDELRCSIRWHGLNRDQGVRREAVGMKKRLQKAGDPVVEVKASVRVNFHIRNEKEQRSAPELSKTGKLRIAGSSFLSCDVSKSAKIS